MTEKQRAQRIASELVYLAINNPGEHSDFAFELQGQKAIVRLEVFRKDDAPDVKYISLGPPGKKCECCDGTGVQDRGSTAAASAS